MNLRHSKHPLGDAYWLEVADKRVAELEDALRQIAATEPQMNLGRKYVDVPVLDAWQAQRVAAGALGLSARSGERDTPEASHIPETGKEQRRNEEMWAEFPDAPAPEAQRCK